MAMSGKLTFLALLALSAPMLDQAIKPKRIPPADARDHLGETATVCSRVADAAISKYAAGNLGWPITLDLDSPEPNPVFIIGTLSPQHLKPEQVEATYKGKTVCATGKITQVRGVPSILTSKPSEIDIQPDRQ
jgi:hypothetical protein